MADAALVDPSARAKQRAPARAAASGTVVAWLLSAPAIIAYVLMLLVPALAMLTLAFTDFEFGARTFRWVGLANFAEILGDRGAMAAVRNTAWYVLIVTPVSIALGLLLAVLIDAGTRGRTAFRAIFFLPVVSLTVAMAVAWQYILHPTIGPLNAVLRMVGAPTPNWLASSDMVMISLGFIGIWENLGFNMVLFLAGLTAIPRDLYAAAEVDGAPSAWSRFWLVTWPMLGPTTLFVVTITTIRSIRVFDTVAILTQGGPNKASEVLLHTMYVEGFQFFRMGYSAAITMLFLAVVLVLMLIQTRLIERRVHYG
jgi:multiple sugar transport system permease protein